MNISDTSVVNSRFYDNFVIASKEQLYTFSEIEKKAEIMLNNRRNSYNGYMSPATVRNVRKIVTTWFNSLSFHSNSLDNSEIRVSRRLTFATLTLSGRQKHDDLYIKRNMLNRAIIELKRYHDVKYYFWRAEKQKNGNIHFHLIVDSYVSNRDLQTLWNDIQKDHGYLDDYFFKFRKYNPPSTHITSISSCSGAIEYVIKYIYKANNCESSNLLKVEGRIWGCSDELKQLTPYSEVESQQLVNSLSAAVDDGHFKVIDSEHFMIFSGDTSAFFKKYYPIGREMCMDYYLKVYSELYSPSNPALADVFLKPEVPPELPGTPSQLLLPFDLNPLDPPVDKHYTN